MKSVTAAQLMRRSVAQSSKPAISSALPTGGQACSRCTAPGGALQRGARRAYNGESRRATASSRASR